MQLPENLCNTIGRAAVAYSGGPGTRRSRLAQGAATTRGRAGGRARRWRGGGPAPTMAAALDAERLLCGGPGCMRGASADRAGDVARGRVHSEAAGRERRAEAARVRREMRAWRKARRGQRGGGLGVRTGARHHGSERTGNDGTRLEPGGCGTGSKDDVDPNPRMRSKPAMRRRRPRRRPPACASPQPPADRPSARMAGPSPGFHRAGLGARLAAAPGAGRARGLRDVGRGEHPGRRPDLRDHPDRRERPGHHHRSTRDRCPARPRCGWRTRTRPWCASGQIRGTGGGAPVTVSGWTCQGFPTPEVLKTGETSVCRDDGGEVLAVLPPPSAPT